MSRPRVALVSGPRPIAEAGGLPLAERELLRAVRERSGEFELLGPRVVGRRSALAHARHGGGQWTPLRSLAWRGADLVHLIGLDVPPPERAPFVVTVHDVSPLLYDDEDGPPPWLDDTLARARVILAISEFTASELGRLCGVDRSRIAVFHLAPPLQAASESPLDGDELAALGVTLPYVLRYGGYTQRKNVGLLLDAWDGIRDATLVLAGPPQPARERLLAGAPANVVVLDYAPATLLARLVRGAAAVASPSLYEGFGLPMLEAMAAGTPVVAARTAFAEEVCGDAALLVEPTPAAFRDGLRRLLDDRELGPTLAAAGLARSAQFTWERAADAVLSAYRRALDADA